MSFENMGLSASLMLAVKEKGYNEPTPIQAQSIPAILKGGDLMACAQTGTGKTAGFTLPLLELLDKQKSTSNNPQALILAPTRELAVQIHDSIEEYSKHLNFRTTLVYGGVKANRQIQRLGRGVDIVVATPGRLLDLYQQGAVKLNEIKYLVLDEADRMLDMGFIHDIKKIIAYLPKVRQNLLFSATFANEIRTFAKKLLTNPVEINVSPKNSAAQTVQHIIHPVDKVKKAALLCHLIKEKNWYQALVFSKTKHGANKLVKQLAQENIQALAIHGNKSQNQRQLALNAFKAGKIQILVATDVAARGIDIAQLQQVVNFDLPNVPEDYVHRIGRTGRAGEKGFAISLVSADEIKQLIDIEKVLGKSISREYVDGFMPNHELPERAPRNAPAAAKRPAQNNPRPNKFNPRAKDGKRAGAPNPNKPNRTRTFSRRVGES